MRSASTTVFTWRYRVVILILAVFAATIFGRIVDLTIFQRKFLLSQGNARSLRVVPIPAFRGVILDRNKEILAVSTPVYAVWADPKSFDVNAETVPILAKLLKIPEKSLKQNIIKAKDKGFVYLVRGVRPSLAEKVKHLAIPGVAIKQELKRFYPLGRIFSHLLGFNNIDDKGIEGVELGFNAWLKGTAGKKQVVKDRLGRVIDELAILKAPKQGRSLHLSVDKRLQYITYRELLSTVKKFNAVSGSVVILDAKTSEVLAMVNVPSYNPNSGSKVRTENFRNRAVTDLFEPGSVMKPFSVASALDSGKFTKDSLIDTSPSRLTIDGNTIHDERDFGVLTVTQILKRSSNIGVTKLVLASDPNQLVGLLHRVGFGRLTHSGFPGEVIGVVEKPEKSKPFVLATLGFGYGLSVNALQLAHAYTVFASGGKLLPVTLIKREKVAVGEQAINSHIARDVLQMLEAVVEEQGTGKKAKVKGYRIAGKTGTSRIAGKNGYEKSRHVASFVGIAPVSNPRFVVAVVIREPRKGSYYGGVVAAPLFARIVAEAFKVLAIVPDKWNGHAA